MKAQGSGLRPVDDSKNSEYFDIIKDVEKYSDVPAVNHNPFVASAINNVTIKKKFDGTVQGYGKGNLVNDETGEVVEVHTFRKGKEVDSNAFKKIFNSRLKDIFNLSKTGITVFGYFIHALQSPVNVNRDCIYIDVDEAMSWCEYNSNVSVYNGLTELIKEGLIAKSHMRNMFYIDPNAIFNGNRLVIYEEYIKKEDNYFDDKSLKEQIMKNKPNTFMLHLPQWTKVDEVTNDDEHYYILECIDKPGEFIKFTYELTAIE